MNPQSRNELPGWEQAILAELANRFEGRRLRQATADAKCLFGHFEHCGATRRSDVTGAVTQRWA